MKLYYSKGSCSLAVRILIHELNIDCEFEAVNLKTKQTESGKDFKSINPKGSVPTLELDNKEIITENPAIQQYLADKFNGTHILPPPPELKRYRVIEWLNFLSSEFHKALGPLFNQSIPDDIKEQYYKPVVIAKLDYLDKYFADHEYLANNQFTMADSYLFVMTSWLKSFNIDIHKWPHLHKHCETVKSRKAVQQSLSEEGLDTSLEEDAPFCSK